MRKFQGEYCAKVVTYLVVIICRKDYTYSINNEFHPYLVRKETLWYDIYITSVAYLWYFKLGLRKVIGWTT